MIEMEYPRKIPESVPAGKVLVHNRVRPAIRQGTRGFRYWLDVPNDIYVPCACPWAPGLDTHYRVERRTG